MDKLYTINMYGALGQTFGETPVQLYAKDLKDIFSGLSSRFGNSFKDTILEGAWQITLGKRESSELKETDNFISEELVDFPLLENEIHIFPAICGAGGARGGGIGQIILGAVLIVAAVVITIFAPPAGAAVAGEIGGIAYSGTAASLAIAGALSIAGGIMSLLVKVPSVSDYGSAGTQKQSFIFNGVINNTEQGVPVPLVYGNHLTGSTVISAGMDVYQIG
jgi:predicted phage tail protein